MRETRKTVYADNAATTRVSDEVFSVMEPFLKSSYGNASGIYSLGRQAASAVKSARLDIAECLNADENEIFFTSGGSESNNWAIKCGIETRPCKNHVIASAIEHHSVMHSVKSLVKQGFFVSCVKVDNYGVISPKDIEKEIKQNTALVSVMMANNEIGTIEPVSEIADICRRSGVLFHTDAVQAAGHIEVDVKKIGADMLSISAHKFHGPKGVGVLFVKKGLNLPSFIDGGAQEKNLRAGTENVAGIAGMAAALKIAVRDMEKNNEKVTAMRDRLIKELLRLENARLTGHPKMRLPGCASFCFEGIEGESLLLDLDMNGICASSGSACTSKSLEASHVLLAMGIPHEIAHGSLRLTLSSENTDEDIDYIIETVPPIVERLRLMSPVWERIIRRAIEHKCPGAPGSGVCLF